MYNLIQCLDFRFLHTNLVCTDLYFSSVKVMIWLSKETAFLQKSEHVKGSLAEPWNAFLALQLPEAGDLQPQTFITHFSETHEAIQHPYLPYHTSCHVLRLAGSESREPAQPVAKADYKGSAHSTPKDCKLLSSPSEKQTGHQNLHNFCNLWSW